MKNITCFFLLLMPCLLCAQPTIDKNTYVNKYRIKGAFLTKPLPARTAKSFSSPIQINGYIWVYPMDLGYFNNHPDEVIDQINAQNKYGKDNWRIPTSDELMTMEENANTIGLGDDIYMCTAHANGKLRLVATKGEYHNVVHIGNTYWAKSNYGTTEQINVGRPLNYQEALNYAPSGYRLPTEEEVLSLIYCGEVRFGSVTSGYSLFLPFTEEKTRELSTSRYYCQRGEYWVQGGKVLYFEKEIHEYGFNQSETSYENPQIKTTSSMRCYVRYVLDK